MDVTDEIISKGVKWNNSRADLAVPQMLKQEHERTTTTGNFVSQRLGRILPLRLGRSSSSL